MPLKLCVSPEAPAPQPSAATASRRLQTEGLRLGILDNSKGNADHLLSFLVSAAQASLPIASVIARRKPTASRPADNGLIEELAAQSDIVISAMAD